ncbi:MAG: hypothetical protein Tsb0015_03960 [Simkaniaceae bacterium]
MKKCIGILGVFCVLSFLFSYSSARPSRIKPGDPKYVKDFNRGRRAERSGDYIKAIQYYQLAVSQKPDYAEAYNHMGYSYRQLARQNLQNSQEAYQKALEIQPENADALEYQGEYFLMTGQLTKAYQNYEKLQTIDPKLAIELKAKIQPVLNEAEKIIKK